MEKTEDLAITTTEEAAVSTCGNANSPVATKRKKTFPQILKQVFFFTCFSAGAAIIQISSFTLLNELCTLPYWPAYLTSLLLSIIFNFTFNRKVTFKSTNNIPRAFCLVVLYYLIFTPLSTMLGQNLTDIDCNEYVVLVCTMLINFVSEFFYQKLFVFDKTKSVNNEKSVTEENIEHDIPKENVKVDELTKSAE